MTTEQNIYTPPPSPQSAPSNGLSIAALILAILVAPIGLILGMVALSQAKRQGQLPSGMTTAAIVVGAVLTALSVVAAIAVTVFTVTVASTANAAAERAAFCSVVTANQSALNYVGVTYWSDLEYGTAVAAIDTLTPAAVELEAVAFDDRTRELTSGMAQDLQSARADLDAGVPDSIWWPTVSSAASSIVDPADGPCSS